MLLGFQDGADAQVDLIEVVINDLVLQFQRNVDFALFGSGLCTQFIELFQFLVDVQTREDGLALLNLLAAHCFEYKSVFPGNVRIPQTQLLTDSVGCGVHVWVNQHGDDADRFRQIVQYVVKTRLQCFVLSQYPWHGFVDVLVSTANNFPDRFQRAVKLELVHERLNLAGSAESHFFQLCVVIHLIGALARFGQIRDESAVVFLDHGNSSGNQVSKVVGQVIVQSLEHYFVGEHTVLSEGVLSQQEVLQSIDAVAVNENDRIDNVLTLGSLGLGDLFPAKQKPSVASYLLWQRQVCTHEHCRPDDGVETYDFLTNQMNVSRPVVVVLFRFVRPSQCGDVVAERIQPYIYYMLFIDWYRDAPVKGRSGNTEVFHALFDECDHFVSSSFRFQEFRRLAENAQQFISVFADFEEVSFFLCFGNFSAAVRAILAVYQLVLGPEGFARRAVPAFVLALVDVALFVHLHEERLDSLDVSRLRGADEIIVGNLHGLPQVLDACNHFVYILLRGDSFFFRQKLDLLTVFVCACQEHDIVTLQSLEPGHGVGHYSTVSVTYMKVRARVINWCADVISSFVFCHFFFLSRLRMSSRLKIYSTANVPRLYKELWLLTF